MSVRVRFAPSPTGALHIGGIRTALYNYLFARKHGGVFLLRIEDTDQNRYVPGAEEYILEALEWVGLRLDEGLGAGGQFGPYRQSERKAIYHQYAHELVELGQAYYAFDSPEALETRRQEEANFTYNYQTRSGLENSLTLAPDAVQQRLQAGAPYVIRLRVEPGQDIRIDDLIRGEVVFQSSELDDKVLLKADGMPTYHLANIVDDHLMGITHVIRGEEWLPSTAHHALLYRAFGWEATMPQFAHLPLILKPVGNGKLSKRDGAKFGIPVFPIGWAGDTPETSFSGFREAGFLPEAVINFLALLGWHPADDREMFSLDELVAAFSLEQINKGGARFDYEKAKWFNQQYLHSATDEQLAERIQPLAKARGYRADPAFLAQVARLMKERATFLQDFVDQGYYLFEPVREYDQEMVAKKWNPALRPAFARLLDQLAAVESFEAVTLEAGVQQFMQEQQLKPGEVLPLLRLALAGTMKGPAVFDMAAVLGKAETLRRLGAALDYFNR
ncbi:MAG: glutamate--tRNA ligase [Saprospiraceae bacterium]|nr:glutamate--tRNA ligase [Saprospiraceae bacterium]